MKILLGVTGGVAAYKAVELLRELQRRGAEVQVVMTEGAEKFVTPLTFASLSGRQVLTSLWKPMVAETATGEAGTFEMEHIAEGQEIDAFVIAPATANTLAKLAHGMADDLLSTMALATTAPVFVAPAMNVNMWRHAATQANVETLRARGVRIVEPGAGYLACGMVGEGRLADPVEIADAVMAPVGSRELAGETVLVTAGGTREAIDPVRFLGNRSSGKMGHALAAAALARGAKVVLVTTVASSLPAQAGLEVVRVESAAEMQAAVLERLGGASIVVMAAAVADYRVARPAEGKLKKSVAGETMTLELVQNDDILRAIVRERRAGTLVIGFAAETSDLLGEGRRKLREKGVDAIVANDVSGKDRGIDSEKNGGVLITAHEEVELPLSSKQKMAERILERVPELRARMVVRSS